MCLRHVHRPIVALLVAAGLLAVAMATPVSAQPPSPQSSAQEVAARYFTVLNAGMTSGNFAALASVYAPDATLRASNPTGVTTVVHGLAALTAFYQGLRAKFPGYQWATARWLRVAPSVVIFYERAGTPAMAAPGRCAHTIVVRHGKIASIDWVTYYPGR
jgi:hypothetical protein